MNARPSGDNRSVVRQRVVVRGRVQGVFFRASAKKEARRLGLAGFARNLPDGSVEVEVEGDDEAVAQMVQWLRSGPEQAVVAGAEVTSVTPTGDTGFAIRR